MKQPDSPLAAPVRDARGRRRSVLVVEDEALIAMDIDETLEDASFEVTGTVASAEQAFAAVKERVPDLVLMDIHLRGAVDGIEAARRLKEEYGVRIIYLTGHSDRATRARADGTRPEAYLLKPFKPKDLVAAVHGALDGART